MPQLLLSRGDVEACGFVPMEVSPCKVGASLCNLPSQLRQQLSICIGELIPAQGFVRTALGIGRHTQTPDLLHA